MPAIYRLELRLYDADKAALAQICASLADPSRGTVTATDAIRDAIHRHPAVCRPVAADKPRTRTAKEKS